MKTLGVLGGMGPEACARFYYLFTKLNRVGKDQEHPVAIILSKTSIPDRTSYIIGESQVSPLHSLIEGAKLLESVGADFLAIPCNTAHYFYDDLVQAISIPIINLVKVTSDFIYEKKVEKVGLLSTLGTLKSAMYQKEFYKRGIEVFTPNEEDSFVIMQIISGLKAGDDIDIDSFNRIADSLRNKGAESIVLGCTELSLINRDYKLEGEFVDVLHVLALKSLILCGANISI